MNAKIIRRIAGVIYAAILIVLTVMFFTNDFGLIDLRKTSVIIGVGLDMENEDLVLTAQLAVPQAAENGESTQFATVTGKGKTVACALNEINVKTGFYPKLVFCRLVLIGESCFERDTNLLLNYFFDNEYTGLTPTVASCKGKAGELLSLKLPYGDSATDSIERLLSEEAQKSGNVSTVNLNKFGQAYFTKSAASYMPFIEIKESETGGENSQQEFLCNRTAVFSKGRFKGVLNKDQSFAFNLLKNTVRHAYTECSSAGDRNVLGLRNCKGNIDLEIERGMPVLNIRFFAIGKVMDDIHDNLSKSEREEGTPKDALLKGEETVKKQIIELFETCKQWDCDILEAKSMLYKKQNKYYEEYKDNLYSKLTATVEVNIKSAQ